jgi:hypothetical protein
VTNPLTQLAWPLAASLALHLGAGWVFSSGYVQFLPRQGKNVTLTVTLAGVQQPEPQKLAQAAAPSAPPEAPVSAVTPNIPGPITEKARFLLAPDLSALENIAVPLSGSLTLRLYVSSLGEVDRIEVIKSDPVPGELLDGLLEKLRQTRLAPALAGSQPVASTLDLVIRYETAVVPLQRVP